MTDFWSGFWVGALSLGMAQIVLFAWASMKVAGDYDEKEDRLIVAVGDSDD